MYPFLQNKFVRFGIFGAGFLVVVFVVLLIITSMNSARSLGVRDYSVGRLNNPITSESFAPSLPSTKESSSGIPGRDYNPQPDSSYYIQPVPIPSEYTSELESYETTNYTITGRTKQFDELCANLANLKADTQIHFKSLTSSLNSCHATFFVATGKVDEVLNTFKAFHSVEIYRNTQSVTRHKQFIESQTQIVQQQLSSVSQSLTMAETQFSELADFARQSKDAKALSDAINFKLQNVDMLTQRKINLVAQINDLYQQASDLKERLDVVQFDVSLTRSNPVIPNRYEQQWDSAWQELKDTLAQTLIGVTAFFGIFLLWVIRIALYALVLILVLRGLWKFGKFVWGKW